MTNLPGKYYRDVKVYLLKSVIDLPVILWYRGRDDGLTDLGSSPNLSDSELAKQLIERNILTLDGLKVIIQFQKALLVDGADGLEYWIQMRHSQWKEIERCRQDVLSHFGLKIKADGLNLNTDYSYDELLASPPA